MLYTMPKGQRSRAEEEAGSAVRLSELCAGRRGHAGQVGGNVTVAIKRTILRRDKDVLKWGWGRGWRIWLCAGQCNSLPHKKPSI